MLENDSKLLLLGESSQRTNTILSVCVASATFCAWLEREALGSSEPKTAAEGARVENSSKTALSSYWEKIIACQAVELADLWRDYGEAAPFVKRLADIEWDSKIQWNMGRDPLQAYRDRRDLIQIICSEYRDAANKLGLQSQGSPAPNNEEVAQSLETKFTNKQQKPLTDREKKIWEVIQRGLNARPRLRGTTYCREVDAARVSPPRKGIWKGGPRTYVAAYRSGDKRLVHWIQNEKTKIRRKAELLGLS